MQAGMGSLQNEDQTPRNERNQVTTKKSAPNIRIVILQRGWVMVGRYAQEGSQCTLDGAYVVRFWGTTKGLGELASDGPLAQTKLDAVPHVEFHALTVIATIQCEASKWAKLCE